MERGQGAVLRLLLLQPKVAWEAHVNRAGFALRNYEYLQELTPQRCGGHRGVPRKPVPLGVAPQHGTATALPNCERPYV
jgi:hypothetical protein